MLHICRQSNVGNRHQLGVRYFYNEISLVSFRKPHGILLARDATSEPLHLKSSRDCCAVRARSIRSAAAAATRRLRPTTRYFAIGRSCTRCSRGACTAACAVSTVSACPARTSLSGTCRWSFLNATTVRPTAGKLLLLWPPLPLFFSAPSGEKSRGSIFGKRCLTRHASLRATLRRLRSDLAETDYALTSCVLSQPSRKSYSFHWNCRASELVSPMFFGFHRRQPIFLRCSKHSSKRYCNAC